MALIENTIIVESINTKDSTRDNSLKSESFLNSIEYPFISFTSTKIEFVDNIKILTGIIKIKNEERKISMSFEWSKSQDKRKIQLKISTLISRKYFELNFGAMDDLIGDDITIELEIIGFSN